ncbi:MAG: hypothetical protein A3J79_05665 [Elusimicrobia bacterium RIFOXYB2_FULL_62_6]|nr:MAG: hypothetical protein A3J79_05665 [Elusimicrobia bacterium RIFOXYB2_FULL_62_6]
MENTAGMNRIIILGAAGALCCSFFGAAFCDPGSSGAAFLRFSPSPRATGMGEAHTAVSEDAYSVYWNPAGLALVEAPSLAGAYNSSFEDMQTQYFAAAWPLEYGSTLGLGISRFAVSPFQGYDSLGVRTEMVDASGLSVGFAYGKTFLKDEIARPVLNAGAGLKYISSRLDDASAGAFALDAGALYTFRPASYRLFNMPAQEYSLALAVRNLGTGLKYDDDTTPLPSAVSLGVSWRSHPKENARLTVSLDNVLQAGDGYYLAAGAELTLMDLLSLRAGWRSGQDEGSGIRAGLGFRLAAVDLDYSISPFGELGNMHKLGLSMKFGRPKARHPLAGETGRAAGGAVVASTESVQGLEAYAQDFLALAQKDLDARNYAAAAGNMRKAFNIDPQLGAGEWGDREKRLSAVVAGLRLAEQPDRGGFFAPGRDQPDTAAASVTAYLEKKELKALLLAHAAFGADIRGPALFEEFLSIMSGLVKMPVRPGEILPLKALVAKKLETSEKKFLLRDFSAAARECEEALLLDEENALGWKRLGSSYFGLGDKAGARNAYEQVLRLDPADASVLRFMELQGWR